MAGINEKQYLEEEVSLRELIFKIQYFIKYLLSKWYLILSAVVVGAVIGYFYNFKKPISYTSYCTFVVEGGQPSPVSGLAALLSGGGSNSSGGSLFQGGTLLSLYTTRLMLEKTLFSKVKLKRKPILLIDWYLQINKEGNSWSEIPRNARGAKLAAIVSKIAADYVTVESGSFVTVKVESPDELFSLVFSERLIQTVNDFYITTKTKKSLQNLNILIKQADSLRTILTISMGGAAIAADEYPNPNPAMKVLAVESQKRNIDVQATTALYSGVVSSLETTKMELRRETPLIQIIDRPMLPLTKVVPDVSKGVIIGGIAGGFILCLLISIRLFYKKLMFNE
jgi:hypothetical protein